MKVKPVDPASSDVQLLIQQLDSYQSQLYPAESNHLDTIEMLKRDHVRFVGAYSGQRLVGIGGVKRMDGNYGEIKRMFVLPEFRGTGVAQAILKRIEQHLLDSNIMLARLETGVSQPEAVAFYKGQGFQPRGPFGSYTKDPNSIYMEKRLKRSIPPAPPQSTEKSGSQK